MISFYNIASGSKGNATLFYNEDTVFLIDMGVSKQELFDALKAIGKELKDIAALFITHEHSDHISGLHYIEGVCPIYAGINTPIPFTNAIDKLKMINVGSFSILPVRTSHDALDPLGYVIYSGTEKFVYMTDTGYIPKRSLKYMDGANYYIIESNHDLNMLKQSRRAEWLKMRIAGKKGHLSNKQSAEYMLSLVNEKTKAIYLAHLSEECNTPSLALETYAKSFEEAKKPMPQVFVLFQHESTRGGDK